MEQELIVRDLTPQDDIRTVARLIYETDEYIYPYMFSSRPEEAECVLGQMIAADTVYHWSHIKTAVVGGRIAGIVVWHKYPVKASRRAMLEAYARADAVADERFERVYNDYFGLLEGEPEGVYIANVCVDKAFRGRGIAKALLGGFLRDGETYHLEAVQQNAAAVRLYETLGFRVTGEYEGFGGVPCYRMTRPPRDEKLSADSGISQ